jgi:hypothetical protein
VPAEKSFAKVRKFLERALKKPCQMAISSGLPGRKSAFGQGSDFAQAHQALLKALENAGKFA